MGSFDKRIAILKKYNSRVKTILDYSFVQHVQNNGVHLNLKISENGIIDTNNFASKEALHATILNLRYFMQDNEDISLRNMAKLYSKLDVSQDIENEFNKIRDKLNSELDKNCNITFGQEKLTNRKIFEVYVYGDAAHETQKEEYQKIFNHPLRGICLAKFHEIMFYFINCIAAIRNVNLKTISELENKNP